MALWAWQGPWYIRCMYCTKDSFKISVQETGKKPTHSSKDAYSKNKQKTHQWCELNVKAADKKTLPNKKFTNRNPFNHLTLIGSIKDRPISILANQSDLPITEKKANKLWDVNNMQVRQKKIFKKVNEQECYKIMELGKILILNKYFQSQKESETTEWSVKEKKLIISSVILSVGTHVSSNLCWLICFPSILCVTYA